MGHDGYGSFAAFIQADIPGQVWPELNAVLRKVYEGASFCREESAEKEGNHARALDQLRPLLRVIRRRELFNLDWYVLRAACSRAHGVTEVVIGVVW